ncbi:hypothetical protein B0T22DRAFT_485175 [Podospora appendiculata]|uniref:Uncharacterized protein n=1 Tax=Podospora appendiculata TaxID=314037 RepID=A0AAE1C7K2_9PEZI|nr:hypothetical protein B0T22DRAFT_485175 [Podospora appendiculata]
MQFSFSLSDNIDHAAIWKPEECLSDDNCCKQETWWDSTETVVKGYVVNVVHGFVKAERGPPCTLIVFEWHVLPTTPNRRFMEFEIEVVFSALGAGPGGYRTLLQCHPWPEFVVPSAPSHMNTCITTKQILPQREDDGHTTPCSLLPPSDIATQHDDGQTNMSPSMEITADGCILGRPCFVGKSNFGNPNAVRWVFHETAAGSGVRQVFCTAVLLHRKSRDLGKFSATVSARGKISSPSKGYYPGVFREVMGRLGVDETLVFDPLAVVETAARFGNDGARGDSDGSWEDMRDSLGASNVEKWLIKGRE